MPGGGWAASRCTWRSTQLLSGCCVTKKLTQPPSARFAKVIEIHEQCEDGKAYRALQRGGCKMPVAAILALAHIM